MRRCSPCRRRRAGASAALYLDGRLQDRKSGPAVGGPITTDLRAVGSERLWVAQNDTRWGPAGLVGAVDDLWVFGRALSDAEVATLAEP